MKLIYLVIGLLLSCTAFAGFRSFSSSSRSSSSFRSFSSSPSRSSFSSFSSRPSSSVTTTRTITTPTTFRPATTGFPSAPRAYVAPKSIPLTTTRTVVTSTRVISRPTVVVSRPTVVYHTSPRYYYGGSYYNYPSVSLANMMLTAALLNAARQDWTYTAIHIRNQTPSRVCRCDSYGRVYDCGLWRDERDYVCKQFRVLPDDTVEWR